MADLQRRGRYTPRRAREQRAYRLVQVGSVAGVVLVAGIVLDIAGVIGGGIPIVAFLVLLVCVAMFRSVARPR
jgi:Zn-dependent membrane protease YugP